MKERDIFFEQINIEPSKIYTNSKFKLKIKIAENLSSSIRNNDKENSKKEGE